MDKGSTKFKKLKQVSMVDQVSDSLMDMITSGEIRPGDRLPSEADLASMYGVNRLTVRMALQKLAVLGLVETRVGEGSFILEFSFENILRDIPAALFSTSSMKEIMQLRRMIEMESIRLAIASATEEEMATLAALSRYEIPTNRVDEIDEILLTQIVEQDFLFHRQLVVCGHNKLLLQIFQLLQSPLKASIYSLLSMRLETQKSIGQHITAGDAIHYELYQAMQEKNWKKSKAIYVRMTDYALFVESDKTSSDL